MKRMISAISAIMLLLGLISGCSSKPKQLTGEEIFEKISPSTVEVYAESDYVSSLGTGFYIDVRARQKSPIRGQLKQPISAQ